MYTVEDINKAKQYLSEQGYGTGSNFTLNTVANLMIEWAAKNCSIPAVIKSVCGDCLYYLTCNHESRDKQICDNYDNEP